MNAFFLFAGGVILGMVLMIVLERFAQWMADGLNEPWDDDNGDGN